MFKLILWTLAAVFIIGSTEAFNDREKAIAIDNLIRENEEYGPVLKERYCSSPGMMCKNCTTTVLCIEIDDGVFEEHAADRCQGGQNCLETKCVEPNVNPHCSDIINYPFRCSSVGVFPNQLDCRKFHLCVPTTISGKPAIQNFNAECSTGYKYNAKTTYCDKKLVNNRCFDNLGEFPVPLCLRNGAMGAIPENPSIFFVCEHYEPEPNPITTTPQYETTTIEPEDPILYPYLYLCAHGKIFDQGRLKCVDP